MSAIAVTDVRIDGGTQSRASIDQHVVAEYAEAMSAGDKFPPVVVFFDGATYWLADGFHRYQAYARAKIADIPADVRQGTQRDAILFSVSANASHGLRRTNDDKRRAVLTLLNDPEWAKWSDREIARRCAVDGKTVAGLRPKASAEVPQIERTVSRKGATYQQNTANIGAQPKPNSKQEAQPDRIVAPVEKVAAVEAPSAPLPADLAEAKLRREFRAMTKEGQEDAYVGLKMDLQDCAATAKKREAEIKALKDEVKSFGGEQADTIRRLQGIIRHKEAEMFRANDKADGALAKAKRLEDRVKELERMGIAV